MRMSAATVHAYHGTETLREFAAWQDRGVYVVALSSNPGGADVQELSLGGTAIFEPSPGSPSRWANRATLASWPEQPSPITSPDYALAIPTFRSCSPVSEVRSRMSLQPSRPPTTATQLVSGVRDPQRHVCREPARSCPWSPRRDQHSYRAPRVTLGDEGGAQRAVSLPCHGNRRGCGCYEVSRFR